MAVKISGRDMLRQLKADLIGKDSHRGVTLTYAWLANQFGHFALGFIPTFVLFKILSKSASPFKAAVYSAVIISVVWLLFEIYNFLGPLLSKKRSGSKMLFIPKERYRFEPAWKNIAFDTSTDLLFFWVGAFAASLLCFYTDTALIVLLVLIAITIYPAYYWYRTKMYLQIPGYPFQFRLSQWDFDISDENKKAVVHFLNNKKAGQHLLVFGVKGSGKTSLAVGIATELSIQHQACIYTTATKLYSMFFEQDDQQKTKQLWGWRSCSALIVDDINPGNPVKEEMVDPEMFLRLVDCYSINQVNRETIKRTNVIWVLGSKQDDAQLEKWKQMLITIGVPQKKIATICLSSP